MRQLLLCITLFFFSLCINAQQEDQKAPKRIKWGVRAGINASVPHLSNFEMDGIDTYNFQGKGRVGFFTSVSWRHIFNRIYLQPEITYSYTNGCTTFDITEREKGENYIGQDLEFKSHSLYVPLFLGYNFIQKAPYIMSVYVGPQFVYNFSSKYYYNSRDIVTDETPLKFNISFGLGAIISHLSFDFRYNIDPLRTNTTHYNVYATNNLQEVTLSYKRRINTMSFAIGYYF